MQRLAPQAADRAAAAHPPDDRIARLSALADESPRVRRQRSLQALADRALADRARGGTRPGAAPADPVATAPAPPEAEIEEAVVEILETLIATGSAPDDAQTRDILAYLELTKPASAGARRVRAMVGGLSLDDHSPLVAHVRGAGEKPKPKRRAKRKRDHSSVPPLFDGNESEYSEAEDDRFDPSAQFASSPGLFGPAMLHSRDGQDPLAIDATNTNMIVVRNGAIVPRLTGPGWEPNSGGHRKPKTPFRTRLGEAGTALRSLQEAFYWASHLPADAEVDIDQFKAQWKARLDSDDDSHILTLLSRTRAGFAQGDASGHAEQSFLRSPAWVNLRDRLLGEAVARAHSVEASDSGGNFDLRLVLNRSSCIACARAMALTTLDFWQRLADLSGLDTWKAAMARYRAQVRFTAQFPTIYMHARERQSGFANLKSVLAGLISAGWTIHPTSPANASGRDNHDDLIAALAGVQADLGIPARDDQAAADEQPRKRRRMDGTEATRGARADGSDDNEGDDGDDGGQDDGSEISEDNSAELSDDAAQRQPSRPAVLTVRGGDETLRRYLDTLNEGWSQPFQGVAAGSGADMAVDAPAGVMAADIADQDRGLLPLSPAREGDTIAANGLRVSANSGAGALCFIYGIVMGLTGATEREARPTVEYVARQAGVTEGWIASDGSAARRVLGALQAHFGVLIHLVVVQHGAVGPIIAGNLPAAGAGHVVVLRQTPGHYDAYVPR